MNILKRAWRSYRHHDLMDDIRRERAKRNEQIREINRLAGELEALNDESRRLLNKHPER